jgi:hypothetical protein
MPPEFNALLPVLSIVLTLCMAVGTVMAFRGNTGKGLSEAQEKAITALTTQNEVQEKQIERLEKKLVHLNRVMLTVEYALKRRGLRIEIDDDAITLIDEKTRANQTTQIRIMDTLTDTGDKER